MAIPDFDIMQKFYPPRVLVAFESSGVLSKAFRDAGFSSWSCDLLPAEHDNGFHLQMDAIDAIQSDHWDLIIAHPTCTALAISGNHVYAKGKPKHHERLEAIAYVERLWDIMCKNARYCVLENPQGVLSTQSNLPKPYYVQPYEHGDDASKKTALYTTDQLPRIVPTKRINGRMVDGKERFANQTDSGQNRLGPSPTRWQERSRTYPGIAAAMRERWKFSVWQHWF